VNDAVCLGCGGPKTAKARLCKKCRLRANAVGEQVWTESHVPPPPSRPRTGLQSRMYHGKVASIARARRAADVNAEMRNVKKGTLEWASATFRREITSSTELTELEMERVLERLDEQLDEIPTPAA
jgi:hypothetical protein